jgi:hypothetical protein
VDATPRLDTLIADIESRHPQDPLAELSAAVLLAERLDDIADHLIGHFVDRARAGGATWAQIGQSLGVTKQAAQKRFVPGAGMPEADLRVFERYTDAARAAIVRAPELARASGSAEIRPAHVVLALLGVPSGIGELLARLGVDRGRTEERMSALAGAGATAPAAGDDPPSFSPAARKALQIAHRESLQLSDDHVRPEHLLLGVLWLTAAPEREALEQLGLTRNGIRAALRS